MKKLIIPAIVIAAVGGYFYYQNMEPATAEDEIVKEMDAAVEEAGAAEAEVAEETDVIATYDAAEEEGDIFADVPELMEEDAEDAMEAAASEAEEMAEEAMGEMPEEEIDHAEE